MTDESQLSAEPPEVKEAGLNTDEYREAVRHAECPGCNGAFSADDHTFPMRDWHDKPHRLVYDLCDEIDRLREELIEAQEELEENTRLMQAFRNGRWRAEDAHDQAAEDAQNLAAERDALLGYIAGRVGSEAVSPILDVAGVAPVRGGRVLWRGETGEADPIRPGSSILIDCEEVLSLPTPPGTPVVVLADDSGEDS